MMQWTAPVTGVAMCHSAAALRNVRSPFLARTGGSGHRSEIAAQPPGADVEIRISAFSNFRQLYF